MKKIKNEISKNKILFIIAFLMLILILVFFLLISYKRKEKTKDIKKHYNKYVITNKKANIYDKNKKVIGKSYNFQFELNKIKKITYKNEYLKVKNKNYYLYYKDVKKINKIKKDKINDKYVTFNKNITSDKITLYKDNKIALKVKEKINMPVEYMDDDNYYVYYLNKIYSVKKNKSIKEIEHKNTDIKTSNNISVLLFNKIDEKSQDYNTITKTFFKDIVNKIKENGYYTITNDEYINFIKENINLKEKAVLLETNNKNEDIDKLKEELEIDIETPTNDMKLNLDNKTSTRNTKIDSIDTYSIKSYSSIENIIKMINGEEIHEKEPVKVVKKEKGVPVLNYHFFYNPEGGEVCNEGICLSTQKFEEELAYIKESGYKALTMDEFVKWIYGEIEVPEKSVLITIDDGAMGTGKHNGNKLIPLLEKYKLHATLFLIAGWWDIENYRSPYLEIESHTYDMHNYGTCKKGQLICANYNEIKEDLQKSVDIIQDKKAFCYPFYHYDDEAISAIKDIGFKVAFAGGNRDATRSSNKYIIPRYPIHSDITMERFKAILD